MSSNMFSVLDELNDAPKKVEKKSTPKNTTPVVTQQTPKKTAPVKEQPKESVQVEEKDGFEKVVRKESHNQTQRLRGGNTRGGSSTRGAARGNFKGNNTTRPAFVKGERKPKESSENVSGDNVTRDVREDTEKHTTKHSNSHSEGGLKVGGRGRFHDRHESGTGVPRNTTEKKRGGGAHNWGRPGTEVEVVLTEKTETTEQTAEPQIEEKVEEKVEKAEKPLDKKEVRKQRKEAEKESRKPKKVDDSKPGELKMADLKLNEKPDPSQKTLEEYQKEIAEKKKDAPWAKKDEVVAVETKKVEAKKVEAKPLVTASDLFKAPEASKSFQKRDVSKEKKSKNAPPNTQDKSAFPTLKI